MGKNIGGRIKNEGAKKDLQKAFIYIVIDASKVSVNGVTCVFVVHFRSSDTFKVCKLPWQFTSVCLPKRVTGNNLVICFTNTVQTVFLQQFPCVCSADVLVPLYAGRIS